MPGYTTDDLDELEALAGADEETIREYEMEKFAESGILPQLVSETGDPEEPLSEVTICSAMSGGADEEKGMPRTVTLMRRLADGTEISMEYVQVSKPSYEDVVCDDRDEYGSWPPSQEGQEE